MSPTQTPQPSNSLEPSPSSTTPGSSLAPASETPSPSSSAPQTQTTVPTASPLTETLPPSATLNSATSTPATNAPVSTTQRESTVIPSSVPSTRQPSTSTPLETSSPVPTLSGTSAAPTSQPSSTPAARSEPPISLPSRADPSRSAGEKSPVLPERPSQVDAEGSTSGDSDVGSARGIEINQQTLIDFADSTAQLREQVAHSANVLVATAVVVNIVSVGITGVTAGTTAVSGITTASQGLLMVAGSTPASQGMPIADFSGLGIMLQYLQFVAAGSHMMLPGAPDFFYEFTDSLGWTTLQPVTATPSSSTHHHLNSTDLSNFTAADGDIISGVLAYAERLNIEPAELFSKTAIAFVTVVGVVAAAVALLYAAIRCIARKRLELVVERIQDLPRAKLLLRLLIQSCLSICLMSEYALSMTSSFQMRYHQQNNGGYGALASATAALIVFCCGLIVLGVFKLWGKTEEQLNHPDFKFAWGAYYKYYHFRARYFFVAKMGAEILSGVIIGLVSDVPSQLTLLMGLQLAMFLYTVETAPYSMGFQTLCSATAFVMKMITYALISSFLTSSTTPGVRDAVGTLVILLQVTLLMLFNSRQLHILYKQMRFLYALRQQRILEDKNLDGHQPTNTTIMMMERTSLDAFTPSFDGHSTQATFDALDSKRNSMVTSLSSSKESSPRTAMPRHFPVAGA
ncbi:hypothetical protein PINS_up008404 [Pythium insidiosum]|nr:hypothetical protein PINS_up008404 [Pythium insidiosum]